MTNVSLVRNCIIETSGPLDGLHRFVRRSHSFRNQTKPERVARLCHPSLSLSRSVAAS